MKILLSAEPHAGKSTLINKVLKQLPNKVGFVTNEILQEGERFGFELISSSGYRQLFASVDYESDLRVSKYGVDIARLNDFIEKLPHADKDSILYIDEIGQMQLYSDSFQNLLKQYLNAPNHLIGTVSKVYDHELLRQIKNNKSVQIIDVTPKNRDSLVEEIVAMLVR